MVSLIMICIILIGGFSIQKIKANRTNPNKISFSVPVHIACFICAVTAVAFGFVLAEDHPFLLVILLIFAAIEAWAGFSFWNDKIQAEETSQNENSEDVDNSDSRPIPWWVWAITAYGVIYALIAIASD